MSHNKFDQFNDLVTRIAALMAPSQKRAHELLDTELTHEVLEGIVGGLNLQKSLQEQALRNSRL